MTTEPICCMVIAPRDEAALERFARDEFAKAFPYAVHTHPWTVVRGTSHAGLLSRLAGSEGSDWALAEIVSREVGSAPVYTLWFDPERASIVEWRDGERVAEHAGSPDDFARGLGFDLDRAAEPWTPPGGHTLGVVEATSVDEVRRALGDRPGEAWLHLESCTAGTLLYADDGDVGTETWDVSEALPEATVYHLQRDVEPDVLSVLVLQRGDVVGALRQPAFDPDTELSDIKGARTREEILEVLGVPQALLGY